MTISDTRTLEDDESGSLIERLLGTVNHLAIHRCLVPDDPSAIESQLRAWLDDPAVNVILTTGGTGIARRDNTIDVVKRLLTIELEGFGELFRMLSWQEVHAAAMLSRAVGGLVVRDDRQPHAAAQTPAMVDMNASPDSAAAEDQQGHPSVMPDVFIFAMPGSRNAVRTAMKQLILPQLPHLVWERSKPSARR